MTLIRKLTDIGFMPSMENYSNMPLEHPLNRQYIGMGCADCGVTDATSRRS